VCDGTLECPASQYAGGRYYATVASNEDNAFVTAFHLRAFSLMEALTTANRWCEDNYEDCRVADISEEG